MKNQKLNKKMSVEEIEKKAMRGEDITQYFSGKPKVRLPVNSLERAHKDIQRVNVDFAQPMLDELDEIAAAINIPRQSLIKTMVREALDKYYTMSHARKAK